MNNRHERYQAAVYLAQLMLEQAATEDELMLHQAIDDIRDELEAGRQNQADLPRVTAELFERLVNEKPPKWKRRLRVVDSAGFSVRVPEEDAS